MCSLPQKMIEKPTRRRDRAVQRWESEKTADATPVRTRARHLDDASDAYEHNAWDDVEMDVEYVAAAEALIAAQPLANPDRVAGCIELAAAKWDQHYSENLRNYHDRRYLMNEYPTLLQAADGPTAAASCDLTILETGCGVGNALLPLLALSPRVHALGCDHASGAVARANERLSREGLEHRGHAFCWDISRPPPDAKLPARGVDTVLALFTLSALPPDALPRAFMHLGAALRPGGQLLLRDYGRLDLKQLKFAKASDGRLGTGHGCEWYARGDGTTCIFFTEEAIRVLASEAGLEVTSLRYDRRLVVNRSERKRMHRVWIVAELHKPRDRAKGPRNFLASIFTGGLRCAFNLSGWSASMKLSALTGGAALLAAAVVVAVGKATCRPCSLNHAC